jgi:hypothetical protein
MTLNVTLSAELQTRLRQEAQRQGVSPDADTLKLLDRHLPAADRRAGLISMLQQWAKEDAAMTPEEAAANAEVLRAIDEDRLSDRKLFTEVVNGDAA